MPKEGAYVYDDRHRRLSVFSESGELLGSHLMPSSFGFGPRPLHVTRTGTLIGQIPRLRVPANILLIQLIGQSALTIRV